MKQKVERLLDDALMSLQKSGIVPDDLEIKSKVYRSKNDVYGDYTSNLAFILAKPSGLPSDKIATLLVQAVPVDFALEKVETAGVGFINFFIRSDVRNQIIAWILASCDNSSKSPLHFGAYLRDSAYCIQYAYTRTCSVLRQLKESGLQWSKAQGLKHVHLLEQADETRLISLLGRYPEIVDWEPQALTYYLRELANSLHSYYNAISLIDEQEQLRCARLCLLEAVCQVLNYGLDLLGVFAPESI